MHSVCCLKRMIKTRVQQVAHTTLVHHGSPPAGYKGGKIFQNRDNTLPNNTTYREYDINPYVKGQNRGKERIVVGNNGSVWYTNYHYVSFTRIK